MTFECTQLSESILADPALVWFITPVNPPMDVQVASQLETFPTDLTSMRFAGINKLFFYSLCSDRNI